MVTLTGQLDTSIEVESLVRRIDRIDGVVGVVNHLTFRVEDRSGLA